MDQGPQLLRHDPISDDERIQYAQTILDSGQILLRLLNDVLDFSKIEAGKLELERTCFQPAALLQKAQRLFVNAAQQKGLSLTTHWEGSTDTAYLGDTDRLRQMLDNLLNNAIKFTSQGSVRVEGRILTSDATQALLEITVRDTGIGITPEQQTLLFQPFSQIDNSNTRAHGGTGLGLSIIQSLAEAMGGEVGLDSTPGEGSYFWLRIPVDPAPAAELESESKASPRALVQEPPQASPALRGRILVVEDNTINQMVIVRQLQKLGLQTEIAANGHIGVERIQTESVPFDAILMDIQMPVLDGYAATRQIRLWEQAQQRPHLPIIALTADAFPEDRERCLAAGMDDFLAKPVDANALAEVLTRLIGKAE